MPCKAKNSRKFIREVTLLLICFFSYTGAKPQHTGKFNETKVIDKGLPQPLELINGEKVTDANTWSNLLRPEILKIFEEEIYGKIPSGDITTKVTEMEADSSALDGKAIRKQVLFEFKRGEKAIETVLLIYLPRNVPKPPIFLGYNFAGNHTVSAEPEVFLPRSWVPNNGRIGVINNTPTESSRGVSGAQWPLHTIIDSGYGLATLYYGDVDPDKNDFSDGVHALLYAPGQTHPLANEWGAIAAWAWGLTQMMDYFEHSGDVNGSKVILMGHSRLGKTALWAAAIDMRFAAVISNNSGCGGAAMFRCKQGETIEIINSEFPHWFCDNFKAYNNKEDSLRIDQHLLISLIAPRPVYIASAEIDLWADPRSEFLAGYYATPVFELFGMRGFLSDKMPPINEPIFNTIGYHVRTGPHGITEFDWVQFIRFANLNLR